MTFEQILVVCFSVGNLTGMILNVKKIPAGWGFVAFAQGSMGLYLVVSGNWQEGIAQYGCLAISLWGLYAWTYQRKEKARDDGKQKEV